ncbi:MAG TPA: rRNA maturation RNase YbeY [Candidatus Saccharimonadales bacterium]|nr:rRNA maturation RNase YbeY [Candidatus Saccharimonadales bacterium]
MAFKVNAIVEPHYPLSRKLLKKAATKTLELMDVKGDTSVDISVIGDRKMRSLNKEFRGKDTSTDVLSFSFELSDKKDKFPAPPGGDYLNLGDVIISYPQLLGKAAKQNMLVDDMATLLVVHGILHLLGFDHEKPSEANVMEKLEDQILDQLK